MPSQKILIIEDDPVIRTQLQTLLAGNGYEAFTTEDFSQVIGTVKRVEPHLVLLDIRLPGEDGFSLCSRIRAFSEGRAERRPALAGSSASSGKQHPGI